MDRNNCGEYLSRHQIIKLGNIYILAAAGMVRKVANICGTKIIKEGKYIEQIWKVVHMLEPKLWQQPNICFFIFDVKYRNKLARKGRKKMCVHNFFL